MDLETGCPKLVNVRFWGAIVKTPLDLHFDICQFGGNSERFKLCP